MHVTQERWQSALQPSLQILRSYLGGSFVNLIKKKKKKPSEGDSSPSQRKQRFRGWHNWIEILTSQVSQFHTQCSCVLTLRFFFCMHRYFLFYVVKWLVLSFMATIWLWKFFLTQRIFKILLAVGCQFLHLNLWFIWN